MSNSPYKPAGHPSVSPYLVVDDAEAALEFIRRVFGAEPSLVHRTDAGAIGHAEVRIDDSVVMLGQMAGGPKAHLHVYVADVDATFQRAVEAGGQVVQAVMEKGDGDRRGSIADACGTTWWLATSKG